jgi:hypothetical protein
LCQGHITEAISLKMMDVAREMADAFGAMARIAGTPIPFNYAQFIKTLVVRGLFLRHTRRLWWRCPWRLSRANGAFV